MTDLAASAVARVRDDDIDVLVFAEHEDGSGQRLEIQRSLEATEQDLRRGMDTYCFVTERGATHYGGLERWSLAGDTITLTLSSDAASRLGVGPDVVIRLAKGTPPVSEVSAALAEVVRPS